MNDRLVHGPYRTSREEAEEDLQEARAASSREQYQRCLKMLVEEKQNQEHFEAGEAAAVSVITPRAETGESSSAPRREQDQDEPRGGVL